MRSIDIFVMLFVISILLLMIFIPLIYIRHDTDKRIEKQIEEWKKNNPSD